MRLIFLLVSLDSVFGLIFQKGVLEIHPENRVRRDQQAKGIWAHSRTIELKSSSRCVSRIRVEEFVE